MTYLPGLQVTEIVERRNGGSICRWHRRCLLERHIVGDSLAQGLGSDDMRRQTPST